MNNEVNNETNNSNVDTNQENISDTPNENLTNTNKKPKKKHTILIILIALIIIVVAAFILLRILVFSAAASAVTDSMDKTRLETLESSAKSIATSINIKVTEANIMGEDNNLYSNILPNGEGYDLSNYNNIKVSETNPVAYYISDELSTELFLGSSYILTSSTNLLIPINNITINNNIDASFFTYNGKELITCLVVNKTGQYYVEKAVAETDQTVSLNNNLEVSFKKGIMYSCSDGHNSWD